MNNRCVAQTDTVEQPYNLAIFRGSLGQNIEPSNAFEQFIVVPNENGAPTPAFQGFLPTAAGYALMTTLAQTAIANENLTLKTGWLSNEALPDDNVGVDYPGLPNVNSVQPDTVVQFTPIGYYSDGSQHPQTNTTWEGNNGSWTSSNPLVMSVSQQGLAFATTKGTATIRYTPASGVKFSSWVMTVGKGPS